MKNTNFFGNNHNNITIRGRFKFKEYKKKDKKNSDIPLCKAPRTVLDTTLQYIVPESIMPELLSNSQNRKNILSEMNKKLILNLFVIKGSSAGSKRQYTIVSKIIQKVCISLYKSNRLPLFFVDNVYGQYTIVSKEEKYRGI